MKIIIVIILLAVCSTMFNSCTGVSVGASFGVGYYGGPYRGGPYGWGVHPGVNVGIYGGGYFYP